MGNLLFLFILENKFFFFIILFRIFLFMPKKNRRIRKGIPNRMRGEMWKVVLDVAEIRLENRDLFQVILHPFLTL